MKFSEQWLREWVNPQVSSEELLAQLTIVGLEVDGAEPVAPPLDGVIVARVSSLAAHPNADKLRIVELDTGSGQQSVVCGAHNVREGGCFPLATLGTVLPDGTKLKPVKLRGVESSGMLCSARELGLAESADGLLELPDDAVAGTSIADYLKLDDFSIDVDLTPNRGDCFSIAGIAREVGAKNRCIPDGPALRTVKEAVSTRFPVHLDAPEDCPRYVGRVIANIDATARTPLWMEERLRRSGLRAIHPVVDVTNYVMLELGQPMHAFDLDRLDGAIRVRRAAAGERLVLLDEQELELQAGSLLIADEAGPLALAGIMGGAHSGVVEGTRNLFLESAYFAPERLSGVARRYGLHTDSSLRFERGVDPELQERAMERATSLLLDIVGGEPGPIIEQQVPRYLPQRPAIHLRAKRIERLLGLKVTDAEVLDILQRLEMEVEVLEDGWRVTAPSFRFDIALEADLIEEIARLVGYDHIPSTRISLGHIRNEQDEATVGLPRQRQVLVERGYQEAISYSFVDPALQSRIDPELDALALANPISTELSVMRTSLWPGLLQALAYNRKRQQPRVRLFESGLVFRPQSDGSLLQEKRLGGIIAGPLEPVQWGLAERAVDFYDLKGDVEALLGLGMHADEYAFSPAHHPGLHPGQSAEIRVGERIVGTLGGLHPEIARNLKIGGEVFLFELRLSEIGSGHLPRSVELSRYPAVSRDIAIILDENIPAERVLACVRKAAPGSLMNLELFDVYRGEGVDSEKKSLALGLTFQDVSRTLDDAEVDGGLKAIVCALEEQLGALLRS